MLQSCAHSYLLSSGTAAIGKEPLVPLTGVGLWSPRDLTFPFSKGTEMLPSFSLSLTLAQLSFLVSFSFRSLLA